MKILIKYTLLFCAHYKVTLLQRKSHMVSKVFSVTPGYVACFSSTNIVNLPYASLVDCVIY